MIETHPFLKVTLRIETHPSQPSSYVYVNMVMQTVTYVWKHTDFLTETHTHGNWQLGNQESMLLFSLGKYSVVELLDHIAILFLCVFVRVCVCVCLFFEETLYFFPQWLQPISINHQQCIRVPFCLHPHPSCIISCVLYFGNSDRCKAISHCGFDLHFPED